MLCLAAAAMSCSDSGGDAHTPSDPDNGKDNEQPKEYEWEQYVPSYPAENGRRVVLSANVAKDPYQIVSDAGYNPSEIPDMCTNNHGYLKQIRHVTQEADPFLGKDVFVFHIHAAHDNDRGLPEITDRQRNEIKTDAHSPADMRGAEGEKHHYRWKFRLPEDFRPTGNFTHIHQLKGMGGDDIAQPLITLTPRYKSSGNLMQLIYNGPYSTANVYLAEVKLEDFLGHWVIVDQWVTYSHTGDYMMQIVRLTDGKTLIFYRVNQLDMWREGATDIRPKYGIYRSITATNPAIKDETIRFADFELTEILP